MLGVIEHMGLKLFVREIIFEEFKPICTQYLNVTDGQTDGQLTVASPRSALASRGKNIVQYISSSSMNSFATWKLIWICR